MKKTGIAIILLVIGMMVTSCDEQGKGQSILVIEAINQVSTPFGDTLANDGTVPSDSVEIVLFNEIKNVEGLSNTTYSDVLIESITVTYNRVDGGSDKPAPFKHSVAFRVPANGSLTISDFPILASTTKLEFPISDLIFYGYERNTNFTKIKIDAVLEISGKTIEGDPVYAVGTISMTVTNWAD